MSALNARRVDLLAERLNALEGVVAEQALALARLDGASRLQFGMLLNVDERLQKVATSVVGWLRTGATGQAIGAIRSIRNEVRLGADAADGVTLDLGRF